MREKGNAGIWGEDGDGMIKDWDPGGGEDEWRWIEAWRNTNWNVVETMGMNEVQKRIETHT